MNKRLVRIVLKRCLGWQKGEGVLIVCDDKLQNLANAFYRAAKSEGMESVLLKMPARQIHGQEPPKAVAAALKTADIAVLFTAMSLSHTQARKQACGKTGTRIASLPGVTVAIFNRALELDYTALKRNVQKAAKQLSRGKRLEVRTEQGTQLTMSIAGRKGFSDDGLYVKPGAFGNLPAGEACIAPCEGTTAGTLMVDGSAPLVGKLKQAKEIEIKNGFAQNLPFPKITDLIKPLGRCALNVAELGIGLNPRARMTGNTLEDEKVKGTAHIAFGANISFGGKIACPCHLDFVFRRPGIYIDGKRLEI